MKKGFLPICVFLSFAFAAELYADQKDITPSAQDLTSIKKLVIFVEQKHPFEVYHWRAKTAYGTASLLGGFEGDAIAHGIDKDKDKRSRANA